MLHPPFLIAFCTTIIRYYDYALFGLSATVLAQHFLPSNNNDQQLLGFFAVFSAAVIARPIGSIIFGFISDKYGRTVSVKIAVFFASLSTSLIAILPDFNSIGVLACIGLMLCRMVFLMSLAGESDAIKIYVAEKIGSKYRNLANGIVSSCSQIGAVLAACAYHFSIKSVYAEILWRFSFIIGGFFGLLIIMMRHYFQESEEFLRYQTSHSGIQQTNTSLLHIIRNTGRNFTIALLISGCAGGVYHFLVIFLGTFMAKSALMMTSHEARILNIVLITVYGVMSSISGFIADIIKPKKQIIITLILSLIILAFVQLLLYQQQQTVTCLAPIILIGLAPFYIVPLQIILQSLFPTNIRTRMYSLSHSLGGMIFSSTTPFFCMLIWQYSHSIPTVLSFLAFLIIVLLCSVVWLYNNIIRHES